MILEIRNDGINEFATLVADETLDPMSSLFECNGQPKSWLERPQVLLSQSARKKKKLPRADISHLWLGSIVLNQRAYDALHELLLPFGQLLELDCLGESEYLYNVTNLVDCIDKNQSELYENGALKKEVFYPQFDTSQAMIFKAPETAHARIYINQAAREQMEEVVTREKLTGIKFSEPGSRPY